MLRKRGDNSTPPLRKVLLPRDAFKQPVRSTFSKYTYVMKMFEAWVIAGGVDVAALRTCTSTQVTGWYNEHILPQLRTMQTLHKYIDDGSKWRCGKNTRSIGLRTLYKRVHKHAGDGFACPCACAFVSVSYRETLVTAGRWSPGDFNACHPLRRHMRTAQDKRYTTLRHFRTVLTLS